MRIILFILLIHSFVNAQNVNRDMAVAKLKALGNKISPIEGIWAIDLTLWSKDKVSSKDLYMEVAILRGETVDKPKRDTLILGEVFSLPFSQNQKYTFQNVSANEEERLIPLSGLVIGSATEDEYWLDLDIIPETSFKFKMATIFSFMVKVEFDKLLVDEFLKEKEKVRSHKAWYKFNRNTTENASLHFTRLYPKLNSRNYNYPTPERWGTCFAIDDARKLLITNEHVVSTGDSSSLVKVWGINGDTEKAFLAKVLRRDSLRDLALLQIVDERFSSFGAQIPYRLVAEEQKPGTELFVFGYAGSLLDDGYPSLAAGHIASTFSSANKETAYKMGIGINSGHSGSPVFDENGNVIAVAHSTDLVLNNISYAAKSTELIAFLKEAGIELPQNRGQVLNRLPLSEKVELVAPFIYRVSRVKRERD